jgi:hypothetical protein
MRLIIPMDTMSDLNPSADDGEHDTVEYDHEQAGKPNPKIFSNDTFSLVVGKDPTP